MKFIPFLLLAPTLLFAQRPSFTLNRDQVETYDYAEITLTLPPVESENPFTDVLLTGVCISPTNDTTYVEGFCDASDGSTHRIRFMPVKPGVHRFTVKSYAIRRRRIKNVLTTGRAQTGSYSGTFVATAGKRKGLLRVDKLHPAYFVYEGTGEHYFWNSTTAYWLMGWHDEQIMPFCTMYLPRSTGGNSLPTTPSRTTARSVSPTRMPVSICFTFSRAYQR